MSLRLIIIIVILVVASLLGVVLVWPKYQDFQQVQLRVKQKEAELGSKTAYYSKIQEIWGRLEEYEDVLSKIDSALPEDYSTPVLFNYLQKTTGGTGLILESLTFDGLTGDRIKEINVNLEALGSYSSLKSFLSALENSARIFKVKSFSFSSPEKSKESFSFELGISAYSY